MQILHSHKCKVVWHLLLWGYAVKYIDAQQPQHIGLKIFMWLQNALVCQTRPSDSWFGKKIKSAAQKVSWAFFFNFHLWCLCFVLLFFDATAFSGIIVATICSKWKTIKASSQVFVSVGQVGFPCPWWRFSKGFIWIKLFEANLGGKSLKITQLSLSTDANRGRCKILLNKK